MSIGSSLFKSLLTKCRIGYSYNSARSAPRVMVEHVNIDKVSASVSMVGHRLWEQTHGTAAITGTYKAKLQLRKDIRNAAQINHARFNGSYSTPRYTRCAHYKH